MMIQIRILFFAISILFLGSCAIQHNAPITAHPNRSVPPNTTIAFVDQNGTFYPNDWSRIYGKPPKNGRKNAYSLSKLAEEKSLEKELIEFEKMYLNDLKKRLANKKRVFILIHGFNASAKNVTSDYELIQNKLNLNHKDEVIQFYWNGLYTKNPFSGMKTWFNASDYSQYAGKFGLRKILNTLNNKDIYLISHSRGASVVLSALSFAAIDSVKMEELIAYHHIDTNRNDHLLLNNKNRITAIALAPAVGKSDFEIHDEQRDTLIPVAFTTQLKVMHITTNENDIMLKKVIGLLSNKLNPTDLGYKKDTFNELSKSYKFLKMTDFTGQKSHDFTDYIKNPKFNEILKKYNLE